MIPIVRRLAFLSFVPAIMLVLFGCAKTAATSTPSPPDPPQITVLKYAQLGATADNAAAHALVTLCVVPAGQKAVLDAPTCAQAKTYVDAAARFFDAVTAEAASADTWAQMRVKIASLGATVTISLTVSNLALQAQISALQTLITNILGVT
jgi:hypothetical protein